VSVRVEKHEFGRAGGGDARSCILERACVVAAPSAQQRARRVSLDDPLGVAWGRYRVDPRDFAQPVLRQTVPRFGHGLTRTGVVPGHGDQHGSAPKQAQLSGALCGRLAGECIAATDGFAHRAWM
jgi:hypothetical protein